MVTCTRLLLLQQIIACAVLSSCASSRFDLGKSQEVFTIGALVGVNEGGCLESPSLSRNLYSFRLAELADWDSMLDLQSATSAHEGSKMSFELDAGSGAFIGELAYDAREDRYFGQLFPSDAEVPDSDRPRYPRTFSRVCNATMVHDAVFAAKGREPEAFINSKTTLRDNEALYYVEQIVYTNALLIKTETNGSGSVAAQVGEKRLPLKDAGSRTSNSVWYYTSEDARSMSNDEWRNQSSDQQLAIVLKDWVVAAVVVRKYVPPQPLVNTQYSLVMTSAEKKDSRGNVEVQYCFLRNVRITPLPPPHNTAVASIGEVSAASALSSVVNQRLFTMTVGNLGGAARSLLANIDVDLSTNQDDIDEHHKGKPPQERKAYHGSLKSIDVLKPFSVTVDFENHGTLTISFELREE